MADAVQTWQRAWMLDGVSLEHAVVDMDAVQAPASAPWRRLGADESGAPAVYYRLSEAPAALAGRWLGLPLSGIRPADASREPLVDSLGRRGGEALLEAIASATHCTRAAVARDDDDLDDDDWRAFVRPWSGALTVRTTGHRVTADWLISCATVDRMLPRRAPVPPRAREALAPLAQALASRKLHATVELERVALSIGELGTLRPGDVLALGHPLDMPLNILAAHGEAETAEKLFGGFLVAHGGRRALKLSAEPSANPS
jgi:hypothetical protein